MRGLLLLAVLRPICADKQRNSFEGGAIAAEAALSSNAGSVIAPIIFVPGLGGSVLEARLHNRSKHRDCASEADWFSLWFSEVQVLTRYDCFIDNVALSYDASTGSVKGPEGVEVRPKDFGGLAGVRYINSGSSDPIPAPYLKTFLQKFEGLGYKDGVNLRAATYDFRTSGTKAVLQAQFAALRGLVEETVATNSGVRAHLVSHSLGTSFVNIFLQDQDAAWTAKHVASAILMSPTNAGTPVAVQGAIMGPVFPYVPQRLPALVSPAVRTFPSILWMFPSEDGGGGGAPVWGNHTFIRTPSANYSIGNLDVLLRDMNATVLEPVFSEVSDLGSRSLRKPGDVPTLCIYANDSSTALEIITDDILQPGGKIVKSTMGDGTINIASLRVCNRWAEEVLELEMGGSLSSHTDIVNEKRALDAIAAWISRH